MPPDDVRVPTSEVYHAAQQVNQAKTDVAAAASKAYGGLQSHTGGWVGDSKKALESAIKELREHSDSLTKRLTHQSEAINRAADRFAKIDARNAKKIADAGTQSKPRLNMDH